MKYKTLLTTLLSVVQIGVVCIGGGESSKMDSG